MTDAFDVVFDFIVFALKGAVLRYCGRCRRNHSTAMIDPVGIIFDIIVLAVETAILR